MTLTFSFEPADFLLQSFEFRFSRGTPRSGRSVLFLRRDCPENSAIDCKVNTASACVRNPDIGIRGKLVPAAERSLINLAERDRLGNPNRVAKGGKLTTAGNTGL